MSVKLGEKVKDSLTGFEGTVVGRAEYLYGCVRCQLVGENPDKDVWIDEQRLEAIPTAKAGGDMPNPPSGNPRE